MIPFEVDDGGRAAAGFKGQAGDCFVRAAAIATGEPYAAIYRMVNELAPLHEPRKKKGTRGRDRTKHSVHHGVLRDTYDCSREGTRCVYGYWSPAS